MRHEAHKRRECVRRIAHFRHSGGSLGILRSAGVTVSWASFTGRPAQLFKQSGRGADTPGRMTQQEETLMDITTLPDDVDRELRLRSHTDGLDHSLARTAIAEAERNVMRRQFFEEAAWHSLREPDCHPMSRRGMQRQAVAATNARILAETNLRMMRDAQTRAAA